MTRDDAFAAAKAKRKQEKADEEARKSGGYTGGDYEEVAYVALELNQYRVLRILGGPHHQRSESVDAKLIEQCMIKGDDGKKFRCTWPLKADDPQWLLRRVYEKVTEGTWEKVEGARDKKVYTHAKAYPELLNRVLYNDNMDNQYESGWRPGKAVLMNAIDRSDMDYHREHKHSKLISKKMSEYGDNKVWFERGIPPTAYNSVWDDVVEYEGNWENYDVVIKKIKDQPYYKAFYGGSDDLRKKLTVDAPEVLDLISVKPLEAWEKEIELYDLDKITPPTSYSKIFSKLGAFIQKVSVDLGVDFYKELIELKTKEAEVRAEKAKEEALEEALEEAKNPTAKTEPVAEKHVEEPVAETKVEEAPKAEPAKTRTRQASAPVETAPAGIPWDSLADGTYNGTVYQGVAKLSDEEKSQVISVRENGSFEYVKEFNGEALELFEESGTKFESPGTFKTCPLSGVTFS